MKRFAKIGLIAASVLMALTFAGCSNQTPDSGKTVVEPKAIEQGAQGMYVNSKWLKENLKDVVVVDARADKDYNNGHIAGSVNIAWPMLSNMAPKQSEKGWGVVLDKDKLGAKIASFGIDGTKTIIVLNDPKGLGEEGRVFWMLKIAGIKDVKMLNGGITAWNSYGGELTKEATKVTPSAFKITSYDDSRIATTEYVKANLGKIKLVDTRSNDEFNGVSNHGENYKGKKALGRIPGAIHIQYSDLYNADGTIKSIADLTAMFEKAGIKKTDQVVTYCTVGIRSGFTSEIFRMCGYTTAKNYNASFSEWAGLGNKYEK